MATFASLTKDQQLGYANIKLNHFLELRRLVQRHRNAITEEEQAAVQDAIDIKVTEEPTVDSYLQGV